MREGGGEREVEERGGGEEGEGGAGERGGWRKKGEGVAESRYISNSTRHVFNLSFTGRVDVA